MKLLSIFLGAFIFLTAFSVSAYPPPTDPLVRIHYDMEVASYCSKITPAVSKGFHRQLNRLTRQLGASKQQIIEARNTAIHEAHQEWGNRGLGGFRGWCKKEGAESAKRFTQDNR